VFQNQGILQQGRNCWRIENAYRAAFLIDAAEYFEAFVSCVEQAKHAIYIAAWDIDSRIKLLRRKGDTKHLIVLGDLLNKKTKKTPGLNVYILCWDFVKIYTLEREWLQFLKLGWKTHHRVHFQLDGEVPIGGCHHQKMVVIDDALAFSGGIDLTKNRWDTSKHRINEPHRRDPDGKIYAPYHDIQMAVDGDAATALGDLFRYRWLHATGQDLTPVHPKTSFSPWPENIKPHFQDVQVALARTFPSYKDREEVREVEKLYLDAIQAAKDVIYIENQYFTSSTIARALAEALKREKGPEIIIVLPRESSGWLEQSTMDAIRSRNLQFLFSEDRYKRLHVYFPAINLDVSVYVHAKIMIVDDRFLRIGSSNLSNRSMGLDSECDLAVEAHDPDVAERIISFRNRLVAEHLGIRPETFNVGMGGSRTLVEVIENKRTNGRRLRPLPSKQSLPIDGVALTSSTSWLDPEKPMAFDRLLDQFYDNDRDNTNKYYLLGTITALFILFGLAVMWNRTPLADVVNIQSMAQWGASLGESPFSLLVVIGAYMAGGVVMFPITLLIVTTALVFQPVPAIIYAVIGSLSNALITYGIGLIMGKQTIGKIAGRKINRLRKRLRKNGILAIAVIRNIPFAPYTIVNIVSGALRVNLKDYLIGTALGMSPGIFAITFFTETMIKAIKNPQWGNIAISSATAAGIFLIFWRLKKRISKDFT
jgi:phospholipase D1/2